MNINVEHAKSALIDSRMEVDKLIVDVHQMGLSNLQLRGVIVVLNRTYQGLANYFESVLNAVAHAQQTESPSCPSS